MPPTRVTWKGSAYSQQEAKRLRKMKLEKKRICKDCNQLKHMNANTSSCCNNKKNPLTLPPITDSSTPRNSPAYLLPPFSSSGIYQEEEKAKLYLLWGRKIDIDNIRPAKNGVSQELVKCMHCKELGHKDISDSRCLGRR